LAGIKRIAILTGGGDCPGLNAVIRAVTKTAIFSGLEVVGVLEGFGGLVLGQSRVLKEEDVSGILPRGGTILGTSNRDDPFHYCSRAGADHTVYEDCSDRAITNLERMRSDALVVTGGDGSLKIALELYHKGVPIVGIPKTIDNDLMATDVTFGFDSAVQTATEAVDKLHTTAESHHRVMVLEVMGRNSGWIALMAGVAGGGDVILIPEIPFTFDSVRGGIVTRRERGKRFSIIVVAEGARLPDGTTVSRTNASGVTVLGGIGEVVAREVESLTGMEARVTVLGHLQRGGPPSPFDRILGTRFGVKAVELVMEGGFGSMVSLRTPVIGAVPLEEAVARQRLVQPDGEMVRFARAVGTSFGDR
jgi:ATP-dependent phosphofructokinase / diphosphate-dependent phosphofructokinase